MARRNRVCLRVIAVVAFALIATSAFNQTQGPVAPPKTPPEPQVKPGQGIKIDVDMTLVNLTVTDPLDRLVTGLEKEQAGKCSEDFLKLLHSFREENIYLLLNLQNNIDRKVAFRNGFLM